MKEVIEKLEQVEEVLQLMVSKMTETGNKETAFPEIKLPDYSQDLRWIEERLRGMPDKFAMEKLNIVLASFDKKIKEMPADIPVRHHHHFDVRSKGFIIAGISLLLIAAITSGLSLSLRSENQLLHENALKYRMVRIAAPAIAGWADSIFYKNPEAAERITEDSEALVAAKRAQEKPNEKTKPNIKMNKK